MTRRFFSIPIMTMLEAYTKFVTEPTALQAIIGTKRDALWGISKTDTMHTEFYNWLSQN